MLDLQKLELEIDAFLNNETAESYAELFEKVDALSYEKSVEISGGYTNDFDCVQSIIVKKPNILHSDSDFLDQNLNAAA